MDIYTCIQTSWIKAISRHQTCTCLKTRSVVCTLNIPVAVPETNMIGTLIVLLLTIPPDIITVADITSDDSVPLNVDVKNVILATV